MFCKFTNICNNLSRYKAKQYIIIKISLCDNKKINNYSNVTADSFAVNVRNGPMTYDALSAGPQHKWLL